MKTRKVADADASQVADNETRMLTGKNHSPHHPTPGPVPHPVPGPRGHNKVATGHVHAPAVR